MATVTELANVNEKNNTKNYFSESMFFVFTDIPHLLVRQTDANSLYHRRYQIIPGGLLEKNPVVDENIYK